MLELPSEIRLHILNHLLRAPTHIWINEYPPRPSHTQHIHFYPAILRTCRQLLHEGADVLYGDNTFETLGHKRGSSGRPFQSWLTRIGERNVSLLRRLRIIVLYPPPRGSSALWASGHFRIDTEIELRGAQKRRYVARSRFEGDEPWTAELEPNPTVEEVLDRIVTAERRGVMSIMEVHRALMNVHPKLTEGTDLADIPLRVRRYFQT
jgi:hypothetical protein